MSSRLFWKLFVTFAVLNVVSIAVIASIGWHDARFRARLVPIMAIDLTVTMIVTSWIVARTVKPIRTLIRAADKMAGGNYDEPVYLAARDELGQLARSFKVAQQEMSSRIAQTKRLSTVLREMSDGVVALDESQHVLFANRAAGEMMGFSPTMAQGRPLLKSVRSHKLYSLIAQLLATKDQREMEMEWGEEENPRTLLVSATSFSGKPSAGVVMMIYNLSEVRRLESMRRDFVANVSHELKTPLSSIKAYAETLSAGGIDDEENRLRFVHQIEEQADRLHQLIADLLSLARIEQGRHTLNILQIPLEQVVRLCVREQRRAADKKNIQLLVQPSTDETLIKADEDGLRQILINLLDNAIKYTPEFGRVTVGWTTSTEEVAFYVQDTGIGIPEGMQDRVFERFFRVDRARSHELGGTGLGLAIVKHLAQSFGGSVELESQPDAGSRFTVRVPATNDSRDAV